MQITTIGLDLAKHWFQVHGVDADGHVVVRRRLWRSGVIALFPVARAPVWSAWKPARLRTIGRVS